MTAPAHMAILWPSPVFTGFPLLSMVLKKQPYFVAWGA